MRLIAAGVLLVSGCTVLAPRADQPGRADLFLAPEMSWIQGEASGAGAHWAYPCEGTGDWGCPSSKVKILSISCDGCTLPVDPTGRSGEPTVALDAIATTDGPITLRAKLQFEPTHEMTDVTATTMGDHEVALEATCFVIETAALTRNPTLSGIPIELFRANDPPQATDTVVVVPVVRTFRGNTRFPFCPDTSDCLSLSGIPARRLSALSISPAPTRWGTTSDGKDFAVLPPLSAGQTVALTAPLLPTGTATTTATVPTPK